MSKNAVRWVLEHSKVRAQVRMVLAVLAEHHNSETGRCDPSIATIAREAGMTSKSAIRALDELEEIGLVTRLRGNGRTRSNKYLLAFAKPCQSYTVSGGESVYLRPKTVSLTTVNSVTGTHEPEVTGMNLAKDQLLSRIREIKGNLLDGRFPVPPLEDEESA